MSLTAYPNGVSSFGAPVVPYEQWCNPFGRHFWVNGGSGATSGQSNVGSDGNDGESPEQALLTIERCFELIRSGDTVHLMGNFKEQVSTPAGVFDVTVIGPSPVTRHPDAHAAKETNGGYWSCRWSAPASPTASTPLVKVRQQGWKFINILFTGDEDDSVGCVQLFRDGGSGDAEDDASHAQIVGCRFAGGLYGIQDSGGCARVKIIGNEFQQFTESDNDAIVSVTGAGIGTKWGWEIRGNVFQANYSDIDADLTGAIITDNFFLLNSLGTTNTIAIDLTGGAEELVARNFMFCASDEASVVNARFVATATGIWGPNYYSDKEEYGEPAE